jgi:cysteine-rich repeat protein
MEKVVSLLKNKKGISGVIVTLIMVVISIIAITIVWGVLRNTIAEESSKVSISSLQLDLEITGAHMDGLDVVLGVKRNTGGGEITGINFIFNDGTQSVIVKKATTLDELDERNFVFSSSEVLGIGPGDLVSIAPVYELGGEETAGRPTDSSPIGNAGQEIAVCGDGILGVGETCDDGNTNDGDGCSSTCQIEGGGGAVCGNTIIETGETCDDGNTNDGDGCSSTCQTEAGPPASCDGVWNPGSEDPEVVCDDGGITCLANCLCPSGDVPNPDNLGGCVKEPSLNNGFINSVWPAGAIKYIDSSDLPMEGLIIQSYIGKYVSFNSITGCFKISYAEYLPEYVTSYIRTELVMVGIGPNDEYEIWTANTCGA